MDIQTNFDDSNNSFVVTMPNYITLKGLNIWSRNFLKCLEGKSEKSGLLLDTKLHEFESVECLKFLREFLTKEDRIKKQISRVAFVQPLKCREPEIVSNIEAYFSNVEEAHNWLSLN